MLTLNRLFVFVWQVSNNCLVAVIKSFDGCQTIAIKGNQTIFPAIQDYDTPMKHPSAQVFQYKVFKARLKDKLEM